MCYDEFLEELKNDKYTYEDIKEFLTLCNLLRSYGYSDLNLTLRPQYVLAKMIILEDNITIAFTTPNHLVYKSINYRIGIDNNTYHMTWSYPIIASLRFPKNSIENRYLLDVIRGYIVPFDGSRLFKGYKLYEYPQDYGFI